MSACLIAGCADGWACEPNEPWPMYLQAVYETSTRSPSLPVLPTTLKTFVGLTGSVCRTSSGRGERGKARAGSWGVHDDDRGSQRATSRRA